MFTACFCCLQEAPKHQWLQGLRKKKTSSCLIFDDTIIGRRYQLPRNWTKKVFAKHLIINREGPCQNWNWHIPALITYGVPRMSSWCQTLKPYLMWCRTNSMPYSLTDIHTYSLNAITITLCLSDQADLGYLPAKCPCCHLIFISKPALMHLSNEYGLYTGLGF